MNKLLTKYQVVYGYKPSIEELYSLYTQGELQLTDSEEDKLLIAVKGSK